MFSGISFPSTGCWGGLGVLPRSRFEGRGLDDAVYSLFKLIEGAGEEVIGGFHPDELLGLGERGEIGFHRGDGAELVVRADDEDARRRAVAEHTAVGEVGWKADGDKHGRIGSFTAEFQNHAGAERESGQ